jgi:ABC-type bacteriocin/lantibiotic exporter with double-glycine peptidase domain
MSALAGTLGRRWIVPEVVQTSAMDCGPASLKSVLEGFRIPVSYGRLREACQTDVDGTSIDTIELLANQLGVSAEQVMIPSDHLFLDSAAALPAVVVVRHSDGGTHFVVVWRRFGPWVQVMDPAIGRRWIRSTRFAEEVFRHETSVGAGGWREWACSDDFLRPLRERLAHLGATRAQAQELVVQALADEKWFGLAALDASVRFIASVCDAQGLRRGAEALQVTQTLFRDTHRSTEDIFRIIPLRYWSAYADRVGEDGELLLKLRGAVLVRLTGRTPQAAAEGPEALRSPELKAALTEQPVHPMKLVASVLASEGRLGLFALAGAMAVAAGAVLIEALLFRGLFDVTASLNLSSQRLLAFLAVLAFGGVLLLIEVSIAAEVMRLGRHLEARLRVALLEKLPRLGDRYFHSRSVSDMAERSHNLQMLRALPGWALHMQQGLWDLAFTLLGVALIDPASVPLALAVALSAVAIPLLLQPVLNESDLRVRNHANALHIFYLDSLLGLVPIRSHAAEPAVRRRHEGLLVEWVRASRSQIAASLGSGALQMLLCVIFGTWLLIAHFTRSPNVSGADLLLVYWTLKLPAIGQSLANLAQQYPALRNVLVRLVEPLNAASETPDGAPQEAPAPIRTTAPAGVAIAVQGGSVLAAGHTILEELEVSIAPGEHVAVVGSSGAGKSSLLGLLLGWHRLATGRLTLDGTPATGADIERLRRAAAWVDPAIQLWNRPFLDNLLYATDDTALDQVGPVLDAARLRSVLQKLPAGLQTYLGEGGALLSGGEGQRVRLARAFLQRDVRLALLDEPFRGLDRTQRHELLAEARQWWKHATLLCVTHDVAETQSFDRVLVVEGGRIVEDGRPGELARQASRYREMLQAEEDVRARLWQDPRWRRIRVENGALHSDEGATA